MDINPITGIRNDTLASPRKTGDISAPRFDIHAPEGAGQEEEDGTENRQAPQRGLADEEAEYVEPSENLESDEEPQAKGRHINCIA